MLVNVRLWIDNHRNILRITAFIMLPLALLAGAWIVDYKYTYIKGYLPDFLLLATSVSDDFLLTLSGVFLTVTTFSLTTTLTVLNKYSDSFTPRIVQDFIDKPNVLSLFGIFIGGFFYTVFALFIQKNLDQDTLVISGTLGIFYAILSMISFVMFTRRVLTDVKAENVIDDIYNRCLVLVNKEAEMRKNAVRMEFDDDSPNEKTVKIYAEKTGYFYAIDTNRLIRIVENTHSEIVIFKKIGEHIPRGVYMANITFANDEDIDKNKLNTLLEKISSCFIMNITKNEKNDYHHEITNLIEIAMRSLSPGINDPNTAILCTNKVSLLLGKLFSSDNYFIVLAENDKSKIVYKTYSVEDELYLSFSQIIHYAKGEPLVSKAVLDGFYLIYMLSAKSTRKSISKYMMQVYEIMAKSMGNINDKELLKKIIRDFEDNSENKSDYNAIRQ